MALICSKLVLEWQSLLCLCNNVFFNDSWSDSSHNDFQATIVWSASAKAFSFFFWTTPAESRQNKKRSEIFCPIETNVKNDLLKLGFFYSGKDNWKNLTFLVQIGSSFFCQIFYFPKLSDVLVHKTSCCKKIFFFFDSDF